MILLKMNIRCDFHLLGNWPKQRGIWWRPGQRWMDSLVLYVPCIFSRNWFLSDTYYVLASFFIGYLILTISIWVFINNQTQEALSQIWPIKYWKTPRKTHGPFPGKWSENMLDFFQGEQVFWVRVTQHVGAIIPFSSWLVFIVGKSSGVFRVITCYHYIQSMSTLGFYQRHKALKPMGIPDMGQVTCRECHGISMDSWRWGAWIQHTMSPKRRPGQFLVDFWNKWWMWKKNPWLVDAYNQYIEDDQNPLFGISTKQ